LAYDIPREYVVYALSLVLFNLYAIIPVFSVRSLVTTMIVWGGQNSLGALCPASVLLLALRSQ
jgi:hypothetical protein